MHFSSYRKYNMLYLRGKNRKYVEIIFNIICRPKKNTRRGEQIVYFKVSWRGVMYSCVKG